MKDRLIDLLWPQGPKHTVHETCGDRDRRIGGRPDQCDVQVEVRRLWGSRQRRPRSRSMRGSASAYTAVSPSCGERGQR